MRRTLEMARREFLATVTTKGFIVGVLVTPLFIGIAIVLLPAMIRDEAPRVVGEVAIVDADGAVAGRMAELLRPEALAERLDEVRQRIQEATPEAVSGLPGASAGSAEAIAQMLGEVPDLEITRLAPEADLEAEKGRLTHEPAEGERVRLALVVVGGDALSPDAEAPANGPAETAYALFVREKLDDRVESEIRDAAATAIVDLRLERAGLDKERIERLIGVPGSAR